jgi:hypothetical protein
MKFREYEKELYPSHGVTSSIVQEGSWNRKTKLLDRKRLVLRLKHMRWVGSRPPPNAVALLC